MLKKNKTNYWIFLVPLLIFAAGAGIFLYPAVSNLLAERNQENVIRSYQKTVQSIPPETLEQAWEDARTYNDNLAGDPVHDPFVMGSGYVLPDNYTEVLNLNGDGVMGYLEIPKIDVYLPIYHGTSEEVLEKGAGHLEVTSLPIGGSNRHSVISAHRGLPSAELFTRLDEMKVGDLFYIKILDETLAYKVDRIDVIKPEDLEFIQAEADKDLVTLLTCTPYAENTHRLLVRGSRTDYKEAKETDEYSEKTMENRWLKLYLAAAGAGLLIVFALIRIVLRHSKKKRVRGKKWQRK